MHIFDFRCKTFFKCFPLLSSLMIITDVKAGQLWKLLLRLSRFKKYTINGRGTFVDLLNCLAWFKNNGYSIIRRFLCDLQVLRLSPKWPPIPYTVHSFWSGLVFKCVRCEHSDAVNERPLLVPEASPALVWFLCKSWCVFVCDALVFVVSLSFPMRPLCVSLFAAISQYLLSVVPYAWALSHSSKSRPYL